MNMKGSSRDVFRNFKLGKINSLSKPNETESKIEKIQCLTSVQEAVKHRTAMGEYIVPPGGKPLTSLDDDNLPGPATYEVKTDIVFENAPNCVIGKPSENDPMSLSGKARKANRRAKGPGPAKYNVRKELLWKDKRITLKGRDQPHKPKNQNLSPVSYNVKNYNTGKVGPRWSLAKRDIRNAYAGPPNGLVLPVDTPGFTTPGPTYCPIPEYHAPNYVKSCEAMVHLPEADNVNKRDVKIEELKKLRPGPRLIGPADYAERPFTIGNTGPAVTMSPQLPYNIKVPETPGPAGYMIPSTIGKGLAKSLIPRRDIDWERQTVRPGPQTYNVRKESPASGEPEGATMTYRPFKTKTPKQPTATTYTINDKRIVPSAPRYSLGRLTRPTYPDSLGYPHMLENVNELPGPGYYNEQLYKTIQQNDGRKTWMGRRPKSAPAAAELPAPNQYVSPTKPSGPSFSLAKRFKDKKAKRLSPGPAAYFPKQNQIELDKGWSIAKRPKADHKVKPTPAPTAYKVEKGWTHEGLSSGPKYTFRSRSSPYVYSGLKKH